ncbi:MAG: hypothetical protein Salg2KO_17820 [Salibacteraceae bacterium]
MELFKPYFEITSGASHFDVVIKVPSNCYQVTSSASGVPADGACGTPEDLNHVITIDKIPGCSPTGETVISVSLNYSESPDGSQINIYVINAANGNAVEAGSTTKKRMHE